MTGFGRNSAQSKKIQITVSLKSVNHRYFDLRTHGPKIYNRFDDKITKAVKSFVKRGACDLYIQRSYADASQSVSYSFETQLAKKWIKSFKTSLKDLGIDQVVTSQQILEIDGYVKTEVETSASKAEEKLLLQTILKAAKLCDAVRSKEGAALNKICLQHMKHLSQKINALKKNRSLFLKESELKVRDKFAKLQKSVSLSESDQVRVLHEMAMIADKTDVLEEIDRLLEHIKNVKVLLNSKDTVGKKLDFYAQELLREINTIGSKSQSAKITEIVVDAKSIIEQFREQVQNVE